MLGVSSRIAALAIVGACSAALASCGGGDDGSALNDALGYLPEDAPVAVAISTDFDGESYDDLDAALQRFGVEGGIDGALSDFGGESESIRSLLGNDLVVGVPTGATVSGDEENFHYVAAIRTSSGDDLRDLLEGSGLEKQDEIEGATVYAEPSDEESDDYSEEVFQEPALAVNGDTLVAADSSAALEDALRRHGDDGHLTEDSFEDRLGDLSADGLIRASGDVPAALDTLGIEQLDSVPWVGSLETFGLSLDVDGRTLTVDAALDGQEVSEDELPVAPGPDSPQVAAGESSFATLDQSRTLEFALEATKVAIPQATVDATIKGLENRLHGSVAALVGAFGSGVTAEIDGGKGEEPETVTRSEVTDPAAVSKGLDALAGDVPRLVRLVDADGTARDLIDAGRVLVPALPVPEEGFFPEGSKVEPVAGQPDLYRLVGGGGLGPEGSEFYFGLLDGAFVTAPSLEAARAAASLELTDHQGPPGSVVGSVPLKSSDFQFEEGSGGPDVLLSTVQIGLETSTTGVRLRLEASL